MPTAGGGSRRAPQPCRRPASLPSSCWGHYLFNGTKLSECTLLTAAPLIAHELWPGHHFQINLSRENTALPPFRQGYYTACGEGWGDYASIVAGGLGLYSYDQVLASGMLPMTVLSEKLDAWAATAH